MNLGLPELIVIFAVALLVFGPRRLPELAKGMGKGIRDFKKALNGEEDVATKDVSEVTTPTAQVAPAAPQAELKKSDERHKEPVS